MPFHELLKKVRLSLGLTLREAAAEIGINHASLRNIEMGLPCTLDHSFATFKWLTSSRKKAA